MNPQFILKNLKLILLAVGGLIAALILNPFEWNEAGYRTVYTRADGTQGVQFEAGIYYQGFFAKEQVWPNRIIISYQDSSKSLLNADLDENMVEIGPVEGMFSDGPTAFFRGTAQFNLPTDSEKMLEIHNDHKNPRNLITARLGVYLSEALNSASQTLNSEAHYSGGRAQMSQTYLEQMRNGIYIIKAVENIEYDSLEKSNKRVYTTAIVKDATGQPLRKASSIKAYGISVSDASIAGVSYNAQVVKRLSKKIESATEASISKQKLMTAEQERLTAEAEGKKQLTILEYQQKKEQTKQVVAAETKIEVAKRDLEAQEIARQAAEKEALKIKTLADAEAYAKQRVMQADGALDKKLDAYVKVMQAGWKAIADYKGNWVPTVMTGGSGGTRNGAMDFMEVLSVKALKDLSVDITPKK